MDIKKAFADLLASELPNKTELIEAFNKHHLDLRDEAKDNRLKSDGFEGQFSEMQTTMKTLMEAVNGKAPEGNLSDIDTKSFAHQIKTLQDSVDVLKTDKETAIGERNNAQLNSEFKNIFGDRVLPEFQNDFIRDWSGRFTKTKEGAWVDEKGAPMEENINKTLEGLQHTLRNNVQGGADTPNPHSQGPKTFADAETASEKFDAV